MESFINSFSSYSFPNYGYVRLPIVSIPDDEKFKIGLSANCTNLQFLSKLAQNGFDKLNLSFDKISIYENRLKMELAAFEELGFTDYVLLVWMVINKAREMNIFIDYGRGSCAGSIVFWLLGLTGVDPIDKNLFFERFVSKTRSKKQIIDNQIYLKGDLIADADLNLGDGREKIVEWLQALYPKRVSKIMNLSTLTGKALIKDVYKSLGEANEDEAQRVSDLVEKHQGIVDEITEVYNKSEDFKKWADQYPDCYRIACKLSSLVRQSSCHASGYLISYDQLDNSIPLELSKAKDGKEGELMSGYDMREVSNFAVKLDLLSLTTNKLIKEILDHINEDITKVNLDSDPLIYDQFQNNKLLPYGLYQISAYTAYKVTNAIKPKNIFELSDVNAIARPGALDYLKSYVDNDHKSPHPLFDKVVKSTRNHILYQEQMMQLLVVVGFTLEEAETCRKIVGKKLVDKVKEWKDKIYDKVKQNNLPSNLGDILWKVLEDSAKYSFNASHSIATSYLSALTVYLKYKYPLQFYTSCLNSARDLVKPGETPLDQVNKVNLELKNFGLQLFRPDLVKSKSDFIIENGKIRYGLKLMKGVSEKSIEKLVKFQSKLESNKFSLFQSINNCGINIGIGSSMIQAGCLDDFGNRTRMVYELQVWNLLTDKEKELSHTIGKDVNYDVFQAIIYLKDKLNEKGKPYIKESRFETIKKKKAKYHHIYELNSRNERLANYFYEKSVLGYSFSESITSIYGEKVADLMYIEDVNNLFQDDRCSFIGFAETARKSKTKSGNDCFTVNMKDDTGTVHVKFFNQKIAFCEESNGRLPQIGDLLIIEGKKMDGDTVFADLIGIQTKNVYTRLSELKDYKKKEDKKDNDKEVDSEDKEDNSV